jgi:anti-sigma regulatory factor (Ser/Thr protein kinase)
MVTVASPDTWVYVPRAARAARAARMTVRAVLHGHGRTDIVDTIELLTSELVTNAYRHTHGSVTPTAPSPSGSPV